jgi:hypothetical protein
MARVERAQPLCDTSEAWPVVMPVTAGGEVCARQLFGRFEEPSVAPPRSKSPLRSMLSGTSSCACAGGETEGSTAQMGIDSRAARSNARARRINNPLPSRARPAIDAPMRVASI